MSSAVLDLKSPCLFVCLSAFRTCTLQLACRSIPANWGALVSPGSSARIITSRWPAEHDRTRSWPRIQAARRPAAPITSLTTADRRGDAGAGDRETASVARGLSGHLCLLPRCQIVPCRPPADRWTVVPRPPPTRLTPPVVVAGHSGAPGAGCLHDSGRVVVPECRMGWLPQPPVARRSGDGS